MGIPVNDPPDGRPFLGLVSALDIGDIPAGATNDCRNAVLVPGNPFAFTNRRGIQLLMHNDNLPAPEWVTGTDYVQGDIVWRNERTYRCITDHTAAADFDADVASSYWERWASTGILTMGSPSGDLLFMVMGSTQKRVLDLGMFKPIPRMSHPQGYQPSERKPEPYVPISEDPEWAYFHAQDDTGASAVLTLVAMDINPLSATFGHSSTVAQGTAAGHYHNGWLVKGSDNRCYWLAWRCNENLATSTASIWTYLGRWDRTTLESCIWIPKYGQITGYTDNVHTNRWETGDVPIGIALARNGDLIVWGNNSIDSANKATPNPPQGSSILVNDATWRLTAGSIPSYLFTSDAWRSDLRHAWGITVQDADDQDRVWANSARPLLIGLSNGNFLLATTSNDGLDNGGPVSDGGINVRQVQIEPGSHPLVIENSARLFTTSTCPTQGNEESGNAARNTAGVNIVSMMDHERYVVARGTSGFSIADIHGNLIRDVTVTGANITAVLGNSFLPLLILWDETANEILLYNYEGVDTTVSFGATEYPELAKSFRGMFHTADQRTLIVVMYDSTQTAGTRNRIVSIHLAMGPDWLTATTYYPGDQVLEGTGRDLYRCLVEHTSGTFATDLAAGYWEELTDDDYIDMTGPAGALEPSLWAHNDSAGSQLRNMCIGETS